VTLPHSPPLHPRIQAVADFFALVYGLRLSEGEDRPVVFACRWVGGHLDGMPEACGVPCGRSRRRAS
jgi:hypothetical protein